MSSFLKQAYALEQEIVETGEELTDIEAAEVAGETEAARQEAEAMGAEVERAVSVHDELENQNDTVREIVEQEGELTPATAAVIEVARRTAAAGLGLDPEDEGEQLVDAAGLESMVTNKGVVALEEAEKATKSLWQKIKDLWAAFVARAKEFWNWLMKLTNFVDKKYKAAYQAVKAMSDEEFNTKLEKLQHWYGNAGEVKGVYRFIKPDGGLYDVDREGGAVLNAVQAVQKAATAAIKDGLANAGEDKNAVGKKLAEKLKDNTIEFANYKISIATKDGKGIAKAITEKSTKVSKVNFTRKDLENCLNAGALILRRIDTLNRDFEKDSKANEDVIRNAATKATNQENEAVINANLKTALAANASVFGLQSAATRILMDGLKAYLNLANRITGTAPAKEEAK